MTPPVGRVAATLRMTEGQLYSATITLVTALLLLLGLGDLHGVTSAALAQQPLPLAPAAPADAPVTALPPVVVPTAPAPLPPLPLGPPLAVPLPQQTFEPAPAPAPAPSSSAAPTASPSPSAEPCDAQPVVDAAGEVIATADEIAGGGLPDEDVMAALGLVTGCDPADPAVVAVGLLIGLGNALPDPGINPVPPVPFVEVPDAVVAALQPARPAIDEVCALVGTGQTVASLFITAYPTPIPQLTAQTFFTALSVCGQVRP